MLLLPLILSATPLTGFDFSDFFRQQHSSDQGRSRPSSPEPAPKDYYKILSVSRTATDKQIKKAYRKLSWQYHPDKNKEKNAQEKYKEINEAYNTLSDKEKRKEYDLILKTPTRNAPPFSTTSGGRNGAYTFTVYRSGPSASRFGRAESFPFDDILSSYFQRPQQATRRSRGKQPGPQFREKRQRSEKSKKAKA
ncbi:DnaJ domain [Perkinsela sp. CCAP 1560/4]|nr:DnaJ domain [Perkinsela sp. CCAP 1560/4]|eukprot:KNH00550.1 DnaJ domain [Perkinsela sp. CCAP 1560/4]